MLTNDQKQFLRHKTLEFFALRPTAAFSVSSAASIMRYRQFSDFPFTDGDLAEIVLFLHKSGLLDVRADEFGAAMYYQITPEGTLKHERGVADGTTQ